ncbi:unnamed protein product [Psylliodes chrysocephalus]|uniref:Major facilitator superfamily (MFS) profile domain-containing protein n=1 Tax=Psylliodes chrysocephalus TaxID=3402493 RepID=A0A9P0G7S5_9CUCU|nr:unnamed protein product [Psylliodes chrysocephala]
MNSPYVSENGPATFEEAIRNTGFGKFNVMLVACCTCGIFSPLFETTTMSYIFAPAHCDLELTLQDKGYLNSACYAGMITSSFIWGFLIDMFGRRKLMIFGYFLDATFVLLSGFSQSFTMLLICKFFGGLIINGPFSAMPAYLSEFHSSNYRSRIQVVNGTMTNIAQILLPLLAWGIMPLQIEWSLFGGYLKIHSWNIFLLITSLGPIMSGIMFIFLPESPKFLMAIGENEKAMMVLKKVYKYNTGDSSDMYPVLQLIQEIQENNNDKVESKPNPMTAFKNGINKLRPLFKSPFLLKFILLTTIEITCMSSLNMLRLWMPQLFQAMEDYKINHNGSTANLCTMLEVLKPVSSETSCTTNVAEPGVYINSIIVAAFGIALYVLTGTIINFLGKKKVLITYLGLGSASCISLFFSKGTVITTLLAAIFIASGNVCCYVCVAVIVDVFPTSLRAFTLSLVMATARIGILIGNILFPMLLEMGCAPPFFVVGFIMAVGCFLCFLLPNTENKALK